MQINQGPGSNLDGQTHQKRITLLRKDQLSGTIGYGTWSIAVNGVKLVIKGWSSG